MIKAKRANACAVVNGGLTCWGLNAEGLLANGNTNNTLSPNVVFSGGNGVTDFAINVNFSSNLTASICAVINGGVKCWGKNNYGELGLGTTSPFELNPVNVINSGEGVTKVDGSYGGWCGIKNGGLICWGNNSNGVLGKSALGANTPTIVVSEGSGVTDLMFGDEVTCIIINGGLKCWGLNHSGSVGNSTIEASYKPVEIFPAGSNVQEVVEVNQAYGYSICARVDNSLKCWGSNYLGVIPTGQVNNGILRVHGNGY